MKYHISDMARILGITPGALHFFESEDIINTKREKNGYRYYDEEDVFRMLSYFKYHSMGVPLKNIASQFSGKEKDRTKVIERVHECRDKCIQQITHYQHLCELIEDHLTECDKIDTLLGNYEFAQSPEVNFIYFEPSGWISPEKHQQKDIQKWVKAMPATRLSLICNGWDGGELTGVLGYSIKPKEAEKLNLPYDKGKIITLPSVPCLHTIVSADSDFAYFPGKIFADTLKYIRKRNFIPSSTPFGNILLVDVDESITHPIIELWFPIK